METTTTPRVRPCAEPRSSIARSTSNPLDTRPKATCLPSSQGASPKDTKNWQPFASWPFVAAIATTLDPNSIVYQNTMDSLNYFMRERELPQQMRMTLRDYFQNARRVHPDATE